MTQFTKNELTLKVKPIFKFSSRENYLKMNDTDPTTTTLTILTWGIARQKGLLDFGVASFQKSRQRVF